jgi:hypothetical protein
MLQNVLRTYVTNFRNKLECLSPPPRKRFQFGEGFVGKTGAYPSEATMHLKHPKHLKHLKLELTRVEPVMRLIANG